MSEVLPGDRGPGFWDGRMTHNPVIVRRGDRWLLFYIGTTFDGPKPSTHELRDGPNMWPWYRDIRIGVAWAEDPAGPWHRPETPLLVARPGMWDQHVVTNPSPHVAADGRLSCDLLFVIYSVPAAPISSSDRPRTRCSRCCG